MAVASFSYTKILNRAISVSPQVNSVVRNRMADGYAKQYDRFSLNFIQYSMSYLMSDTEYQAFLTWWKSNKATFFDFVDPFDDATYDGRMVSGEFSAQPLTTVSNFYEVNMTIERIL